MQCERKKCGAEFQPTRPSQRYCDAVCQREEAKANYHARRREREKETVDDRQAS